MSDIQAEATQTEQTQTSTEETQTETTQQEQQSQQPDTSWVPKRISEITAARRRAEEERDAERAEKQRLAEELAALKAKSTDGSPQQTTAPTTQPQSKETVEQLAKAYAQNLREQERMQERVVAINTAGAKEFGADYDKAADALNGLGVVNAEFLKVLTNIPNPEKVVTWLGKAENLNEAMRIGSLDPVQMGIEMTKLSDKAAKAFAKQISKAPAPIEPVAGRGSSASDGVEPDPSDQKAWIKWRNQNARKRR